MEYSEAFSSSDPPHVVQRVINTIKQSTSKVILAFTSHMEIKILASELHKQNITGIQWIGSDAWITDSSLTDSEGHTILVGSLGFTVAKAKIPGLEEHLRQLHPSQFPNSQFVKDFWEEVFDCCLNETGNTQRKPCSGLESLKTVESLFTDVSELRFTKNVYKSVLAVAHALDMMFKMLLTWLPCTLIFLLLFKCPSLALGFIAQLLSRRDTKLLLYYSFLILLKLIQYYSIYVSINFN